MLNFGTSKPRVKGGPGPPGPPGSAPGPAKKIIIVQNLINQAQTATFGGRSSYVE